jgi:hypothetical protein
MPVTALTHSGWILMRLERCRSRVGDSGGFPCHVPSLPVPVDKRTQIENAPLFSVTSQFPDLSHQVVISLQHGHGMPLVPVTRLQHRVVRGF